MQSLHQVEQESRQPFLCPHTAQEQHHPVLTHDFAAHDFVHMVLQRIHLAGEFFDALEGHDAHFGIFQCHGVAGMVVIDDAVQTNDLASHLEAGDLVAPIFSRDTGLEEPRAYGKQRGEGFTVAEQGAAALDFPTHGHHVVNTSQLLIGESQRHAKLTQIAIGAGNLDGLRCHMQGCL